MVRVKDLLRKTSFNTMIFRGPILLYATNMVKPIREAALNLPVTNVLYDVENKELRIETRW